MVSITPSLSDPNGSHALVDAVTWLQGTLLGTVATIVSVIAVSVIGLRMISGHIDARRGTTAIIGCFILFGAPMIAAGLRGATAGDSGVEYSDGPVAPASPIVLSSPTAVTPAADPYAGASLP